MKLREIDIVLRGCTNDIARIEVINKNNVVTEMVNDIVFTVQHREYYMGFILKRSITLDKWFVDDDGLTTVLRFREI